MGHKIKTLSKIVRFTIDTNVSSYVNEKNGLGQGAVRVKLESYKFEIAS